MRKQGDLVFYVGNTVRNARLTGMIVTGGLSAVWSRDGWGGNRLGELRVRADDISRSELCAIFHK